MLRTFVRSNAIGCAIAIGCASESQAQIAVQEIPSALHFRPADHVLGDVHPYFHDGECFLYYLKPSSYDVALVRSRDLVHWTAEPLEHKREADDAWMRPYYVLSVLRDDAAKVYRSFYGYRGGQIVSSLSDDLIHWLCGPKEINIPAADYYERRRDPYVFWIEELKSYGCVMTTHVKGMPAESGGAISLATSKDLKAWTDHGPIVYPKNMGEPECPQMFKLADRWYLLASIYNRAVGRPVFWTSQSPMGPWSSEPLALEGKDLCAAQFAMNGSQLMLFGWIPSKASQPGNQSWGGHLALPREVFALEDGKLGVKLARQMSEYLDKLPQLDIDGITLLDNSPSYIGQDFKNASMKFNWQVAEETDAFEIDCGPLGQIEIDCKRLKILDASNVVWSEQEIDVSPKSNVPIRVIVEDDIVEVFINDKYSLVARLPGAVERSKIGFRKTGGNPKLSSIKIAELNNPKP